jgi:hypothetical protein
MWEVDNRTPFAADADWLRDRDGADVWIVAVKATFSIAEDGTLDIAAQQPPVIRVPVYHGDPATSSLKYDTDLVLTKSTTDVLVVGHACAAEGRAVEQLEVGFKVGPVQKVLHVAGDRTWGPLGASPPEPFSRMPIVYERSFGGRDALSSRPDRDWHWENPVGCGFAVTRRNSQGLRLPNIEARGSRMQAWDDRPRSAGFGPLCTHWKDRAAFAGTYDERWKAQRYPLLPDDFDDRFFQSAPADQQAPAFLVGGEPVLLVNLTSRGRLQFRLPRLRFGFDSRFFDGSRRIHPTRHMHTVIVEPDVPRVSLVWQSALRCHDKPHKLERTLVTLKEDLRTGEPISLEEDLELM